MDHDAYRSYHAVNLNAQTARATPVQLVLILMNGLLEELARARAHIEAGRFEQKATSLDRCIEIINGLSSSLDVDAGGEVVENLARLYEYCAWRLYNAGFKLDTEMVDEVAVLLTTLKNGWLSVQDGDE
ncbi:MAG: flagellar export chaperone FliS [Rhizobacter sp.]